MTELLPLKVQPIYLKKLAVIIIFILIWKLGNNCRWLSELYRSSDTQCVKCWPTDLVVLSLSSARGIVFPTVNGVPLHAAFQYQLLIILIWLKYCWKGCKIARRPSIPNCANPDLCKCTFCSIWFSHSLSLQRKLSLSKDSTPFYQCSIT